MDKEDAHKTDYSPISTDVDKLIKTVSARKRIDIRQLEQESGIKRVDIERWLGLLEEEGYVKIEYNFTNTYIVWVGEEMPETNVTEIEYEITPGATETKIQEIKFKEPSRIPMESIEQNKEEIKIEENVEDNIQEDDAKLKENILENITDDAKEERSEEMYGNAQVNTSVDADVESMQDDDSDKKEAAIVKNENEHEYEVGNEYEENGDYEEALETSDEYELPESKISKRKERLEQTRVKQMEFTEKEQEKKEVEQKVDAENFKRTVTSIPTAKAEERIEKKKMKDLVDDYLEQIAKQKADIESLRQEKTKLYKNRYVPLETKVESDISSLTEKVLEKQAKILELKEKILELPDKIEEVEKLNRTMNLIQKEGRAVMANSKEKINQFLREITETKQKINAKVDSCKELMNKENQKVMQLDEVSTEITNSIGNINSTLSETKTTIENLNQSVDNLLRELQEASEMKVEIAEVTNRIRGDVRKKTTELEGLEQELGETAKIEDWVRNYIDDYETKVSKIQEYVAGSEQELDSLREAAEAEYMKKYLNELEGLTKMYELESEHVGGEERNIDDRMDIAKKKLDELLNKSKEMIKRLHDETADLEEFEPLVKKTAEKTEKAKKIIVQKQTERGRIVEEINTRKTRTDSKKSWKVEKKSGKKDSKKEDKKEERKKDDKKGKKK